MTWRSKLSLCAAVLLATSAQAFDKTAASFYTRGSDGQFLGANGVPIAYRVFRQKQKSLGTVVVASGFSESMPRYSEVALDLYNAGYSVVLFDHRGQGRSGRMISDRHRGYVDAFENFVGDLKQIYERVAKPLGDDSVFLLAHSMGGAIGARYLEIYPADFSRAVLSAPMLQIQMPAWQRKLAPWLLWLLSVAGFEKTYVRGPTDPATYTFQDNQVTHDPERYEALQMQVTRDNPEDQLWGATAQWLDQALVGTERARAEAKKVAIPVLILQAEHDSFVNPSAQEDFCSRAANCKIERFAQAKHEVFIETDAIRGRAIAATVDFFSKKSASP